MSITMCNVTHTYMQGTPYERQAITDINLTIEAGEFIGIIGHTGSGKSTLIQHLNGLLKPTAGEVIIDGVSLQGKASATKAVRHRVGMVFQYPEHQLFEETIREDIAFGPRNMGLSEEEIDKRVRASMTFVGLDYDTFAERSPFRLSGGQMRRVAIAGVIAIKPDYLILDEPSAGLDPRGRREIFDQIIKLHKTTGIAVALVSHNMEDIARMATRLIVMHKGKIKLDGTPKEIFGTRHAELAEAGVDIPPITALMRKIHQQGLNVDDNIITAENAVLSIKRALKEPRK